MRWADVMLQKVAAVVQDLQDEKEGRRLSEQILPQAEAFQVSPAMRGQAAARSAPASSPTTGHRREDAMMTAKEAASLAGKMFGHQAFR